MKKLICTLLATLLLVASASASTFDSELESAVLHMKGVPYEDQKYIKFLTTYAVPEDLRQKSILTVSFWLHSLTGPTSDGSGNTGFFYPLAQVVHTAEIPEPKEGEANDKVEVPLVRKFVPFKQVAGSDTLWWIDIRDYNWTEEAYEYVSLNEPYIRKPWVSPAYDELRHLTGNALIRADWFLVHTSNTTKQFDRNIEPFYYQLLYAQVGVPKTATEYRNIWNIDVDRATKQGLIKSSVVEKGESYVSRHIREISGIRTDLGYHWETSDYKTMDGDSDIAEYLGVKRNEAGRVLREAINRKADAHEYITSNNLGMQVYFLTDGNEKRIEFADPTIVVHTRDRMGDVRVRQTDSCIVCHAQGINPSKNLIREALNDKSLELIVGTKEFQQAVEKTYLTDLGKKELSDQTIYADAMLQANGLKPLENMANYQDLMDWYDKDVTLEQAALECGVTVDEFVAKVSRATGFRLPRLANKEKSHPIPREVWEDTAFETAMLHLKALPSLKPQVVEKRVWGVITQEDTPLMDASNVLAKLKQGTKVELLPETTGVWRRVKVDNLSGWVKQELIVVNNHIEVEQ